MDVATCMSSGGCSLSPLRDEEDDGIFFFFCEEGPVDLCACFSFIFILKEERTLNMQPRIRLSVNRPFDVLPLL